MIDVLAIFLLYKFEASWYWWIAFIIGAIVHGHGEYKRWSKIELYLDNAEKEYNHTQERRKKYEKHIYLGGMLDE